MTTHREHGFVIAGRITNLHDQSLEGLSVRAFDYDPTTPHSPLGEANTGPDGRYSIQFSVDRLRTESVGPDVYIQVYREHTLLGQSPVHDGQGNEITVDLAVDHGVTNPEAQRIVRGAVRDVRGAALANVPLMAFDRDLRSEQPLGQTRSDYQGRYQISYERRQFHRHEKGEADLVVKAFSTDRKLIASSEVSFNAPDPAEIDVIIGDVSALPSLFERITEALAPLLGDVAVADLEEDETHQDLTFLSAETGFPKGVLARFVLAHRLVEEGLPAEFWFAVLNGQAFNYVENESLAGQLPQVRRNVLALKAGAVRASLADSLDQNEISAAFRGHSENWIAQFLRIASRSSAGETTFVGQALQDAGVRDAERKEQFARLFLEHQALTPELLKQAEERRVLNEAEIADLQVSFQLADLTQADFSVVKAVKEDFGVRRPEQVRSLAKRSENEWVELVERRHSEGVLQLPVALKNFAEEAKLPEAAVFGRTLERQFREAFPTTAFAGGLERALQNGGSHGLKNLQQLSAFLEQNQDFDLLTTSVDQRLGARGRGNGGGLAHDTEFARELKGLQRVFKVAPRYEQADALLADGLDSAQKIYRMGQSEFVRSYENKPGFTRESARLTWRRSADTHAAVLTIVGDLKARESEGLPKVIVSNPEALETFPNWDNLFQTGDLCECEQCRSVLSPAAYFADLLMFLRGRKAANPARTVKDLLFDRRPDLGYLELNCENAFTTLPYIDVVCEVLENVIAAGEYDLELQGFAAMPAGDAARAAVAAAFAAEAIELGATFTVSQVNPADPELWVVHGDDIAYLLKKKATPNFFAEILRNTKASAAELRAYPQYVNPKAYEKLRAARYPMTLPFDLFAEEVRSAFQKTNLQRWDLMRTLHGAAAPNNPSDGDIAEEYFGISVDSAAAFDEKRIILTPSATVPGQKAAWGEPGADWLNKVGNVKNFLLKTGLEYNDILKLLDLEFINPAGDISIHHLDASCDLDKKVIQVLDAEKLDRIHRLLRLSRKLKGWEVWELDLVIRHPAIGAGVLDEPFLVKLYYLNRLKTRLGTKVKVEQLCALFDDLNTETHFTELYKKRIDGHYQSLFLNKRLINPLDPAFILDTATGDLPAGELMSAHHPVLIAALAVREADLLVLKGLTKASDGLPYLNDDLDLSNLSFLWRHAWLAKLLKFKIDDWQVLLKMFAQDVATFAGPQEAWEFVERADQVKLSGFSPDELNWILGADPLAKAAVKEADASRLLTALRTSVQSIRAEFDVNQYAAVMAAPPTDVEALTLLLTSLLQKLDRDETSASNFIKTLQGGVVLTAPVQGLPAAFVFPGPITGAPNNIPIQYDALAETLRFRGTMTEAQRNLLLTGPMLAAITANASYASAVAELFEQSGAAPDTFASAAVQVVVPGLVLPAGMPSLPIRYNNTTNTLSFTGLMRDPERLALNAAGNPAAAIDELFRQPRLAVKFYQPVFTAPLEGIPSAIDFQAQLTSDLAAKISYDVERRELTFEGIMLSTERDALDALVPAVTPEEITYHAAVNSLFNQPQVIMPPDTRVWLTDADLDPAIPANDTLAKRLANAITKSLAYLSTTMTLEVVIEQCSAQLDLTVPVTQKLVSAFGVLAGSSLLTNLTGAFSTSSGVVDPIAFPATFQGWYWANRSAALLKQWKVTLSEWEQMLAITAGGQLLDLSTLPLMELQPVASIDHFLRSARLLRLRGTLPETEMTFLELLENLQAGRYPLPVDFAQAVEELNEVWLASDVESLVNALDLVYPGHYLLAENWERLRRAFYFLEHLTAGADVVKAFAAAAMGPAEAQTIKELLRAKFGEETWLILCAEIQDVLRERKRDALTAHLLAQAQPADAPSGKWENTNDLYAYYLLDVEMSSCMLTSRLVQGSGSIQLFVQRCFMGLEPEVVVETGGDTGDSAWKWWQWMSKYRVWEANRKVFLWPENWIEPELKKDRSSFMKDLENDLLQNEINQDTVEAAFSKYLEKLDTVAQLEIAGFYHEDDGDLAILHVFGRTRGAEPHLYYYRRFDYRQWTPWERVELDIQGDYLVPVVINKRLFLFWPVFTEVPYEQGNSTSKSVTFHIDSPTSLDAEKPKKLLRMQLAASDYRQGKWTPRRISKDAKPSGVYDVAIEKKNYVFYPVDRSEIDGRFGIRFEGHSIGSDGGSHAHLSGVFEVTGCTGVPELASMPGYFVHTIRPETLSAGDTTTHMKWLELASRGDAPQQDFTLETRVFAGTNTSVPVPVLNFTPWFYRMTPPWHLSYFDRLSADGAAILSAFTDRPYAPVGSWLPYFYNDKKRTFFVLPTLSARTGRRPEGAAAAGSGIRYYYPDIKKGFRLVEDFFEGMIRTWLDSLDFATLNALQRQALDTFLFQAFPEQAPAPIVGGTPAPYNEFQVKQIKDLITRWYMRFFHYWMGVVSSVLYLFRQFEFRNFYHPFVCDFAKLVYNPLLGIPVLMSRDTQLKDSGFSFLRTYQPTFWVVEPGTEDYYPRESVDFSPAGAYSCYNWELFYHAVLFIANSLSRNQRFQEARDWYHFIFNPIGTESAVPGGSAMSKYWITKPFFETTDPQYQKQRIDNILRMLAGDTAVPGYSPQAKKDLEDQVLDWRTNPFEPHRIANYRTVAYQKTVVMKYLDNLIAWGDYLFRQDSMESTNEATQLYIMAAEILGPKPKKVPPQAKPPLETFNELEPKFDVFSNALVEVENLIPVMPGDGADGDDPAPLPMLYFCIPHNDKLLSYWDIVADRLYKLRHCMNIEGVVRQLSLFEPPIDPAALVKAVAGGLSISSALADLSAPLPLYRFNVLLLKANEVCGDVKALGSALLSALEKKDAEALALLRQSHEIRLLEAVKSVRETQIEEAKQNLEAAKKAKELAEIRKKYYESREFMNATETAAVVLNGVSIGVHVAGTVMDILGGALAAIPDFDIGASGFGGSPVVKVKFGGVSFSKICELAARGLYQTSTILDKTAGIVSTVASYERRKEDWDFQKDLAIKEIEQSEKSIASAELRVALSEKELENQMLQIDNSKAVDQFMRTKYTNQELYTWQIGQISGVYFQSYRLAYDLAKRAEMCFRFELGAQDGASYINFGYWDGLKKGLLSGEKLQYDLRRMESAYLEQNRREYELTKNVSLSLLDPFALVKLRETGRCFINLPEHIFDLDFPGHYFRRIRSVSLTVPCVVGPYTTLSCTLRLLKNGIRINTTNGDNGYPHNVDDEGLPTDDLRFIENNIPAKSVAVSTAQNDSGMFELAFQDSRYLPFEGAGVISSWSLELFNDGGSDDFGKSLRQFDYATITDAILHVKYMAREDAGPFKSGAIQSLREYLELDDATPSFRFFDLRQEFPTEWYRFLNPTNPVNGNVFELGMSPTRFRILDSGKTLKINSISLLARCSDDGAYQVVATPPLAVPPPAGSNVFSIAKVNQFGGLHFGQKPVPAAGVEVLPNDPPVTWQLRMTRPGGGNLQVDPVLNVMEVQDLLLILGYEWE